MGNLYVLFVDSFLLRDPLKKKQKNMSKKRHFQHLRVARGDADLSKERRRQMPYEKGGGEQSRRDILYIWAHVCIYVASFQYVVVAFAQTHQVTMEVTVHMCLIQLPDAFMKLNCHDLKKKKEPKLPVQKVYEVRLCLVQKISTRYKSTFRRFPGPHRDGFSKTRKVQFLVSVSRAWKTKFKPA